MHLDRARAGANYRVVLLAALLLAMAMAAGAWQFRPASAGNNGGSLGSSGVSGDITSSGPVSQAQQVIPVLRHVPDDVGRTLLNPGLNLNTNTVIDAQDVNVNVRGSRHTICTVDPTTHTGIAIPGITLSNIVITNGGGYASTADTDPDFTDARIFTGDGYALGETATAGVYGATCISWVSTDAGDQQINLVYVEGGVQRNVSWSNTGNPNQALIKEWNRLEESWITYNSSVQTDSAGNPLQQVSKTAAVVLDPATGYYVLPTGPIHITDTFAGGHTNSAGGAEYFKSLAGVEWEVDVAPLCAEVDGDTQGVTYLNSDGTVGGYPDIYIWPGGCLPGQTISVRFTGSEPGPLGSGEGTTVEERVLITLTQNVAEKQVFLAWAGQRVILEHDWRIAAGDGGVDGSYWLHDLEPTPNGICPFGRFNRLGLDGQSTENQVIIVGPDSFFVQYVKGSGPGNFVPGLGALVDGSDQALVSVGTSDNSQTLQISNLDDDIINDPQDNCISRVLYESEDPGEVDIEAFAQDLRIPAQFAAENYTKVAFVIYYMKINTINVSLVTQVSKPTHNNSYYADFAPGNPWDATKDDADNATDWNVSKDILVRGRVTGWFTNSNPSGRPADTSNPLNVLPADRWVMPQDWPLLAGGPADPADGSDATGTAEQFRPYYDIMFAPNNARGLALADPDGVYWDQLTVVATGNTGKGSSTSPIKVQSCADLPVGRAINIASPLAAGNSVGLCSGGFLVLGTPLTAAPAAGTPILFKATVPFEGPYSLLDIIGFANEGKGGAALSNLDSTVSWAGGDWVGASRDTGKADGDVDMWDAPMPPAMVSVALRGTGFIKAIDKANVYYIGTPNSPTLASGLGNQVFPNPFYISNIPDSPFIPAVVAGGGYLWNSWGNDGPGGDGQGDYAFWEPVLVGTNSEGVGDALSSTDSKELGLIRNYYEDNSIARDLVVYSDNHGEFMVVANGDFKTDLTACATNVLSGGKHCKPGDKVGTGTIMATVDYPDFRGKHFPVLSNAATVTWTWGGYKDVTVENGETDQYKYIVFHAMDRDGFCSALSTGAVLLHSVLASSALGMDDADTAFTIANLTGAAPANARYNDDPVENVDFLIDSGEGIIIGQSGGGVINDGKQFASDIPTFSVYENDPATSGIKEFPLSSLAASGQTDECQAWIKVSNSLLGILNVLAIANDDEGNIGFDKIIDLTNTTSYTLNFRWSLITWAGADNISVSDAIKGTGTSGKNPGGNDISASVTAIYGWDGSAQQWLGYFPSGVNVPGANDLTALKNGQAYWIAITGPSSVTWTIASNVN